MQVDIEVEDDAVTAYISGEIDHHNAPSVRREVDMAVERVYPEKLVLDLGRVTFMDSSGIGLIMGRWKLMQTISGELVVANAPDYIKKVMRVAGLEKLCQAQRKEAAVK